MSYYVRSDLDFELADLLCEQFTPYSHEPSYERNGTWDMPPTLFGGCRFDRASLPSFAHDRNACAEAEAEIARRGLQHEYVNCLVTKVDDHLRTYGDELRASFVEAFALITAPPEARVRAMLEVLER